MHLQPELYCTVLYCIKHKITLHCVTWHYIKSHNTILRYIALHGIIMFIMYVPLYYFIAALLDLNLFEPCKFLKLFCASKKCVFFSQENPKVLFYWAYSDTAFFLFHFNSVSPPIVFKLPVVWPRFLTAPSFVALPTNYLPIQGGCHLHEVVTD